MTAKNTIPVHFKIRFFITHLALAFHLSLDFHQYTRILPNIQVSFHPIDFFYAICYIIDVLPG